KERAKFPEQHEATDALVALLRTSGSKEQSRKLSCTTRFDTFIREAQKSLTCLSKSEIMQAVKELQKTEKHAQGLIDYAYKVLKHDGDDKLVEKHVKPTRSEQRALGDLGLLDEGPDGKNAALQL